MVEYASLQTLAQGLTQAVEAPGSGKRTVHGLTVLVDGMLGDELVNAYAK